MQENQGPPESADREQATPAEELTVAALVRRAADELGPDQAAKDRMRARVLARWDAVDDSDTRETDADLRDGEHVVRSHRLPSTPVTKAGRHALRPRKSHAMPTNSGPARKPRFGVGGRALLAVGGAACLLLSLSGMGMLLSRDAVPGDTLYGLKRTAENASLNLAFDEHDYATRHLEVASTRLHEIESLAARGDQDALGAYYRNAFGGFDRHMKEGTRLITRQAAAGDYELVDNLRDWANEHGGKLAATVPHLPSGVREDATKELRTLGAVHQRATVTQARRLCKQVFESTSDELGPIPSNLPCDGRPAPTEQKTMEVPKTATPEPTTTARQPSQAPSSPNVGEMFSSFFPRPPWMPPATETRSDQPQNTLRSGG